MCHHTARTNQKITRVMSRWKIYHRINKISKMISGQKHRLRASRERKANESSVLIVAKRSPTKIHTITTNEGKKL